MPPFSALLAAVPACYAPMALVSRRVPSNVILLLDLYALAHFLFTLQANVLERQLNTQVSRTARSPISWSTGRHFEVNEALRAGARGPGQHRWRRYQPTLCAERDSHRCPVRGRQPAGRHTKLTFLGSRQARASSTRSTSRHGLLTWDIRTQWLVCRRRCSLGPL
jgi:hypothetical protein